MTDFAEGSFYCTRCGDFRLHRQERSNAVYGLILALFTCGIYLLWLIFESAKRRPWRCSVCGLEYDEAASRRAYLEKHPEEAARIAAAEVAENARQQLATVLPAVLDDGARQASIRRNRRFVALFFGIPVLALVLLAIGVTAYDEYGKSWGPRYVAPTPEPTATPAARSGREWYDRAPEGIYGRMFIETYLANNKHPCLSAKEITQTGLGRWRIDCALGYVYIVTFNAQGNVEDVERIGR